MGHRRISGLLQNIMRSFLTKELIDAIEKCIKIECYLLFAYWFVDLLPKLPTQISEPLVEMLLNKLKG